MMQLSLRMAQKLSVVLQEGLFVLQMSFLERQRCRL